MLDTEIGYFMLEPTLGFPEKHSFRLSSSNVDRAFLNSEPKPIPI